MLQHLYNLGATSAVFSSLCPSNWRVIDAWVGLGHRDSYLVVVPLKINTFPSNQVMADMHVKVGKTMNKGFVN